MFSYAGTLLSNAANEGDAATVKTMLSTPGATFFINYQDARGYTPLHCTAGLGNEAIAKLLMQEDVRSIYRTRMGARHSTSRLHVDVTKQLIASRLNINLG